MVPEEISLSLFLYFEELITRAHASHIRHTPVCSEEEEEEEEEVGEENQLIYLYMKYK